MSSNPVYKNIVIKIGTSTLAHETGNLNIRNTESIVKVVSDIKNMGVNVIIVSSGAIGVGFSKLGISKRPNDMPSKQAAAAVGQCELMYIYDKLFAEYNHVVAQVLLTADIFDNPSTKSNAVNTFAKLAEMGTIPIVNENDTVAIEEIEFGDNDSLSALVALLTNADALIILSDIDGLYDHDPKKTDGAVLIEDVYEINEETMKLAENTKSSLGTGGMYTKLRAAQSAINNGVDMHIINGTKPSLLYDVVMGKKSGTYFHKKES